MNSPSRIYHGYRAPAPKFPQQRPPMVPREPARIVDYNPKNPDHPPCNCGLQEDHVLLQSASDPTFHWWFPKYLMDFGESGFKVDDWGLGEDEHGLLGRGAKRASATSGTSSGSGMSAETGVVVRSGIRSRPSSWWLGKRDS